jgi:hypothetical protein
MEEDAGNKIMMNENKIEYITPETKMCNNIINAMSIAMGINIENQKEFILNGVLLSIRETVESENEYKKKVREMAEKGKRIMSYKDFYNTSLFLVLFVDLFYFHYRIHLQVYHLINNYYLVYQYFHYI